MQSRSGMINVLRYSANNAIHTDSAMTLKFILGATGAEPVIAIRSASDE